MMYSRLSAEWCMQCVCACVCVCKRMLASLCKHVCVSMHARACVCVCVCTCVHACMGDGVAAMQLWHERVPAAKDAPTPRHRPASHTVAVVEVGVGVGWGRSEVGLGGVR